MDPAQPKKVAVFVDVENLAGAFQSPLEDSFSWINEEGRIYWARAYGNWTCPGIAAAIKALNALGAKLILPSSNQSGKNSADMHLALDALELSLGVNPPETVVIFSNDRDFVPLMLKLRERHIRVVGAGTAGNTSRDFLAFCDRFVPLKVGAAQLDSGSSKLLPLPVPAQTPHDLDQLKEQTKPAPAIPAPASTPAREAPPKPSQTNGKAKGQAAIKALIEILKKAAPQQSFEMPWLGQQLRLSYPGLSLKADGYSTLTALVSEAESKGLVKTTGPKEKLRVSLTDHVSSYSGSKQAATHCKQQALLDLAAEGERLRIVLPRSEFRITMCLLISDCFRDRQLLLGGPLTLSILNEVMAAQAGGQLGVRTGDWCKKLLYRLCLAEAIVSANKAEVDWRTPVRLAVDRTTLLRYLDSTYLEEILEANPHGQAKAEDVAEWLYRSASPMNTAMAAASLKLARRRLTRQVPDMVSS